MGRIDEALRRAAATVPAPAAATTDAAVDPFTSPWSADDPLHKAPDLDLRPVGSAVHAAPVAPPPAALRPRVDSAPSAPAAAAFGDCRARLSAISGASPLLHEQFRRLAATLIQVQRTGRLKILVVTSAGPSEGKTLTSVNLALELSESFQRRVLLIDADLRRPRISQALESAGDGVAQLVNAPAHVRAPVMHLTDSLALLPAGRPDPNALSALSSERMQQLLEEAAEAYEWVILDTPPVGVAADASLLCGMADGTVLVVRANHTPYPAVEQAIETVGRERIVGVVLNGVDAGDVPAYGYYTFNQG
jgi:capsular exopolysaccharide synthesis family protein